MSVQDLNQRYQQSYVQYNGVVKWCAGFNLEINDEDGPEITIFLQSERQRTRTGTFDKEKFIGHLLNILRPRSRWYKIPAMDDFEELYVFLNYRIARQWSRGFNTRTTVMYTPAGHSVHWPKTLEIAYQETDQCRWRRKVWMRDIEGADTPLLLSPYLLYTGELKACPHKFFYKDFVIASYNAESKEIQSRTKHFEQELHEFIPDARINPYIPNVQTTAANIRFEDELRMQQLRAQARAQRNQQDVPRPRVRRDVGDIINPIPQGVVIMDDIGPAEEEAQNVRIGFLNFDQGEEEIVQNDG